MKVCKSTKCLLQQERTTFAILAAFKLLPLKTQYTRALFAEILCTHIRVFSGTSPQMQELFLEPFSDLLKTKQSSSTSEYRKEVGNQPSMLQQFSFSWNMKICLPVLVA